MSGVITHATYRFIERKRNLILHGTQTFVHTLSNSTLGKICTCQYGFQIRVTADFDKTTHTRMIPSRTRGEFCKTSNLSDLINSSTVQKESSFLLWNHGRSDIEIHVECCVLTHIDRTCDLRTTQLIVRKRFTNRRFSGSVSCNLRHFNGNISTFREENLCVCFVFRV